MGNCYIAVDAGNFTRVYVSASLSFNQRTFAVSALFLLYYSLTFQEGLHYLSYLMKKAVLYFLDLPQLEGLHRLLLLILNRPGILSGTDAFW